MIPNAVEEVLRYYPIGWNQCRTATERVEIRGDAAGMHLLVRFEDPKIGERAAAAKVHLASSAACYLSDAPRGEFVMGFSSANERSIREAVRRLADTTR